LRIFFAALRLCVKKVRKEKTISRKGAKPNYDTTGMALE
jgi:hypothetical protein